MAAKRKAPKLIERGSPEHRFMLGIDKLDSEDPEQAKQIRGLEKALEAKVPTTYKAVLKENPDMERKEPPVFYKPEEHIIDGWYHRSGR